MLDPTGGADTLWVRGGADDAVTTTDGGWELVGVIGAAAAILGVVGAGRYSLDAALTSRRGAVREEELVATR